MQAKGEEKLNVTAMPLRDELFNKWWLRVGRGGSVDKLRRVGY